METSQTRCSLRQSPLMTQLPRSPGSTLVLRLNQETVHDFVLLFLPPCSSHFIPLATGSLEPLSSPHMEASPATTFGACSSLAPTPVKPHLHLQYLAKSQSTRCQSLITPGSDHPPVLEPHGSSISPLMSALTTHTFRTKEKRKRKETTKRNFNKRSKAKGKAKIKITWRRQVSVPLGKGNGSTQQRLNKLKQRAKDHQTNARKPQRAPLAHMQTPPEPVQLPLDECMQNSSQNRAASPALLSPVRPVHLTGQTSAPDHRDLDTRTGQTGVSPVRLMTTWELQKPKNGSKLLGNPLDAFSRPKHVQTSPPCWQCMNYAKNQKNAT
jgi:hypothetical protein